MTESYRVKKPGDVLHLKEDLPEADAGIYVLLSIGDTCCLSCVGEDEAGNLCSTSLLVWVTLADLSLFLMTGLEVDGVR